jgi:hypothetical protein
LEVDPSAIGSVKNPNRRDCGVMIDPISRDIGRAP